MIQYWQVCKQPSWLILIGWFCGKIYLSDPLKDLMKHGFLGLCRPQVLHDSFRNHPSLKSPIVSNGSLTATMGHSLLGFLFKTFPSWLFGFWFPGFCLPKHFKTFPSWLSGFLFFFFWFPGFFCPDILKHPLPCALLQGSTTPCRGRVSEIFCTS